MVELYSGTPGSGKSLHIAKRIINTLRYTNKLVICNFPINLEYKRIKKENFRYIPNEKMTCQELVKISREFFNSSPIKEDSILLVIDECQLVFNARDWQQNGRNSWLSFFTQHRHYGFEICLIAQFDRMIDRQIRSLIEYNFIHRKVSNFGVKGKLLSLCMGGNVFVSVKVWYPLNEKVSSEFIHCRKRIYSVYDSYATF